MELLSVPPWGVQVVLLAIVIAAAVYDVRYRRIPNWISVGGIAVGLAINSCLGPPVSGFVFGAQGLALGFGLYFALYALHAMGAGDVKLMGAVGAMLGWRNWLGVFFLTAIIGGVAALTLALARKRLKTTFFNLSFIMSEMKSFRPAYLGREELDVKSSKSVGLPHGALIALAVILFFAFGAFQ